jgi:hypothetical protein
VEGFSEEEEPVNEVHRVEGITFTRTRMLMTVDGKHYSCAMAEISDRLAQARDFEREEYEISPSGYGIHWPLVDEDLTVDGLLRVAKTESQDSRHLARVRTGKVMAVAEERTRYRTGQRRTVASMKK